MMAEGVVMQISTIVVGVDFSEQSEAAAVEALGIAQRAGAKLVLVHVGDPPPEGMAALAAAAAEWERALRQQATEDQLRLETLVTKLSTGGVEVDHRVVDGHPDDGVCEAAKELGAELVVTGSHGRSGLTRFLLGSVAERIVRQAETNVLVARGKGDNSGRYRRIRVLTDFSPHAERTLEMAISLVEEGGEIDVVHYYQLMLGPGPTKKLASQAASSIAEALKADVEAEGAKLLERHQTDRATIRFIAVKDSVMHGIQSVKDAEPPYDVIAVGSHGHRGFRRWILGSVAEKAMRYAECSVLIVHDPNSADD